MGGLDFKPWPKEGRGIFTVRVDRNVRAHIHEPHAPGPWMAEKIGRHGEMGHG